MEFYIITVSLLALAFVGISIKIVLKKDGKFSGTCASNSPFLNNENKPCGICGKLPEEKECKKPSVNLN